jgi:hypothetical protein
VKRAIDPITRLAAADPARELPVEEAARATLWSRIEAGEGRSSPLLAPERRRRWATRPLLLIAPLLLVLAAAALAAGGVIQLGSPAKLPFSSFGEANPHEGYGALVPGTVHMVPIAATDPGGGLDWGMRLLSTSRGQGCIQIGRLLDGKLGALGQDGAFGDDGRFHELPVSAAFDMNGCALLDGDGRLFTNVTADERAASAWVGTGGRLGGCVPASAGPYEKGLHITRREREMGVKPPPICRQSDLRNVYYGLLGPQAQSITYVLGGQRHTLDTVGADGAYLFVTRASAHQLLNFANAGTADVVPVDGPIKEIHYRDGATCHLTAKSWIGGAYACTPSLSEPVGYVPVGKVATHAELATPIRVRLGHDRLGHTAVVLSFKARVAVADARSAYSVIWYETGMKPGQYAGTGTDADVAAGQTLTFTLGAGSFTHGLPRGVLHGTVSLLQQTGAGGLEGPGSERVPVGGFAIHVP